MIGPQLASMEGERGSAEQSRHYLVEHNGVIERRLQSNAGNLPRHRQPCNAQADLRDRSPERHRYIIRQFTATEWYYAMQRVVNRPLDVETLVRLACRIVDDRTSIDVAS